VSGDRAAIAIVTVVVNQPVLCPTMDAGTDPIAEFMERQGWLIANAPSEC
jgi:hypothetical protein